MTQQQIKIFLDLDDTLIDTHKIKDFLYKMVLEHFHRAIRERNGEQLAATKLFNEVYHESVVDIDPDTNKLRSCFTMELFVQKLRAKLSNYKYRGVPIVFFEEIVDEVKQEMSEARLAFAGVEELLQECRRHGINFRIITLGAREWQEEKIRMAGLDGLIDVSRDLLVTGEIEDGKNRIIREELGDNKDGTNCVLFNDKPAESMRLLSEFKDLILFFRIATGVNNKQFIDDHCELIEKYGSRVIESSRFDMLKRFFEFFFAKYGEGEINNR